MALKDANQSYLNRRSADASSMRMDVIRALEELGFPRDQLAETAAKLRRNGWVVTICSDRTVKFSR